MFFGLAVKMRICSGQGKWCGILKLIERNTSVWKIDSENPEPAVIERAAAILRAGGLVAFPTETVYGLGANGLDAAAVAGIYEAKGRPARNPIILHVASVAEAMPLVTNWPERAQKLAERFWPGPLTIILPRSDKVPDIVTGGGPTVAIRCPSHSVAHALIREAGVPIAAPSANRSSEISPTLAEHVLKGLDGRIDAILDGGPTHEGIESTVLDLSGAVPRLLRPGPIAIADIEAIVGPVERLAATDDKSPLPSPGMLDRHYAPRTPMERFSSYAHLADRSVALWREGKRIAMIHFSKEAQSTDRIIRIVLEDDPEAYGSRLYRILHELDEMELDRILVQMPPETDEWLAIRDRLKRASIEGERSAP